ncbi:GNAT family N-acetyltransferase [Ekhidna sp.]|uniref:GNAT family N-acetyltransferase n=1 Tax=Ekhidna sp. TaxID=2608089 RepID=UPI003B5BB9FB
MPVTISQAQPEDHAAIGQLMVGVYSSLPGFATPEEQPAYYQMLANIGDFTVKESVELLVAKNEGDILGAVVYIGDMQDYGAAINIEDTNAVAFRLLAVSTSARGLGVGKLLTNACLDKARLQGKKQMIIHTTESMKVAWGMYEKIGFVRSTALDFVQSGLQVYGFKMGL